MFPATAINGPQGTFWTAPMRSLAIFCVCSLIGLVSVIFDGSNREMSLMVFVFWAGLCIVRIFFPWTDFDEKMLHPGPSCRRNFMFPMFKLLF
jgi:hypothetical protein